jgi:2-keto-4-pentenoate hydratase
MALREDDIAKAGVLLAGAWSQSALLEGLPDHLYPGDFAEAAAIQTTMAAVIGDEVVGWKVAGAPGPMIGRIFGSHLYAGSAVLPARQAIHRPAIESEVGFQLNTNLPVRSHPYEHAEVMAAATLTFTFEIVGTRFSSGMHIPDTEYQRLAIIADNSAGAGLVVGPQVQDWRDLSLLDIPIELRVDDGELEPSNPMENRTDPVVTLTWLANELSDRGIGLRAGQYVTTGSATLLREISPGSTAVARFGDFGEIKIALEVG